MLNTANYKRTLSMICYKFNYPHIMEQLIGQAKGTEHEFEYPWLKIMLQACNVRNRRPFVTFANESSIDAWMFNSIYIFDADEMLELITIFRLLELKRANLNMIYKLYYSSLMYILGKTEAQKIIRKYYPNFIYTGDNYKLEPDNIKSSKLCIYLPPDDLPLEDHTYTSSEMLFIPGLAEKIIPEQYLGIFYATSGKFCQYINWSKFHQQVDDINSWPGSQARISSIYGYMSGSIFSLNGHKVYTPYTSAKSTYSRQDFIV